MILLLLLRTERDAILQVGLGEVPELLDASPELKTLIALRAFLLAVGFLNAMLFEQAQATSVDKRD